MLGVIVKRYFFGALFLMMSLGWSADAVVIVAAVNAYWDSLELKAQEELASLYYDLFRSENAETKKKKATLDGHWRVARKNYLTGILEANPDKKFDSEVLVAEVVRKIEFESSRRSQLQHFDEKETKRKVRRKEVELLLKNKVLSLYEHIDNDLEGVFDVWDPEGFQKKLQSFHSEWLAIQAEDSLIISQQDAAAWIEAVLGKDASAMRGAALLYSPENMFFEVKEEASKDVTHFLNINENSSDALNAKKKQIILSKDHRFRLELLEHNYPLFFVRLGSNTELLSFLEEGFHSATDAEIKKRYAHLLALLFAFRQSGDTRFSYLFSRANRDRWLQSRNLLQDFINENPLDTEFNEKLIKLVNQKYVFGIYKLYPPQSVVEKARNARLRLKSNCAYFLGEHKIHLFAAATTLFGAYQLLPETNRSKMETIRSKSVDTRTVLVSMNTREHTIAVSFVSDMAIEIISFEMPSELKERQAFLRELKELLLSKYKKLSLGPLESVL